MTFAVAGSSGASVVAGAILPNCTLALLAGFPGQTITALTSGDTATEPDEGFTLTLANATKAR